MLLGYISFPFPKGPSKEMVVQFGGRFSYNVGHFVKAFLKKFYSIHKTTLIRKNIMQFRQEPSEPFWRYFERFKYLLAQCPPHGVEKWRQCQILYDGLDYQTKILLEIMCRGDSCKKKKIRVGIYLKI